MLEIAMKALSQANSRFREPLVVTRLNLTKGSVLQGPGECLPKGGMQNTKYQNIEVITTSQTAKEEFRMVCYLGCTLKAPMELLTNSPDQLHQNFPEWNQVSVVLKLHKEFQYKAQVKNQGSRWTNFIKMGFTCVV